MALAFYINILILTKYWHLLTVPVSVRYVY